MKFTIRQLLWLMVAAAILFWIGTCRIDIFDGDGGDYGDDAYELVR